ncbi:OsmC family protein [Agromyces sp. SYSU K20354]|uniref:OsmC family protein n=1 Tax=Agromyces cavernae TaxID=2898659 RepID=UPI001E3F7D8C|nr:OsmC family protein [Agromyces cavernae]MCD2441647.1 OsmC family protein [Agromyces cavernae]
MSEHAHQVSERIGPGSVSVTRTGSRSYEGLNERGATVRIGGSELEGEHFTPGELLKIALIGCAGLSTDRVAARRLGDEYAITIWAHGVSDPDENRYTRIEEELLVDLGGLDPSDRTKLIDIMERAIERGCTVARSIEDSIDLVTTIDGTPV